MTKTTKTFQSEKETYKCAYAMYKATLALGIVLDFNSRPSIQPKSGVESKELRGQTIDN